MSAPSRWYWSDRDTRYSIAVGVFLVFAVFLYALVDRGLVSEPWSFAILLLVGLGLGAVVD